MTAQLPDESASELSSQAENAFRKLGKSVCILSCFSEGKPHLSVATAVCNVSNTPPSLLICLEKTASLTPHLARSTAFAVNVLGADQQEIVDHCMKTKAEQRLELGNWNFTDEQLPVLYGSQANFLCRVAEVNSFETHHILIARIEACHCSDQARALIYLDGKFHTIDTH